MRLIDADKINFEKVFIGASDFAKDTREAAQKLIDEQPTAYDVDKVVEQINDLVKPTAQYRYNFCGTVTDEHCTKHNGCEYCITEQILRIVKSGGIE